MKIFTVSSKLRTVEGKPLRDGCKTINCHRQTSAPVAVLLALLCYMGADLKKERKKA